MALNFQDVIRDVHDKDNHALQISGTIQAAGQATVSLLGTPTVMVGTPTLYAVVNTTASSGLATVNINGSATIFAVVNTSAAGVGNSIVTINPRVDYIGLMSVSGNVNISNPTLYAVVNTSAAGIGNSIVTINPRVDYIGLMSVSGNVAVSSLPAIPAGTNNIGFATVTQVNQPALVASDAFIGLVTVANTVAVSGTVAATQSGTWDEVGINDSGNSITVDNAQLSVVGTGTEAAAMRVTIASDSTGVLSVDDNGGAITVDGTVAVTGVSTLAEQQTQTTHLATIAGDTTSIQTSVQLIDDTVTVLGTDTYTEASSKGLAIGAVRRDADTTLVNTTNEWGPLQMDANGRLKVEVFSGETLPVGDGTDAINVLAAGADGVANTNNQLVAASLGYVYDTAAGDYNRAIQSVQSLNITGDGLQAVGLAAKFDDTTPTTITENQFGHLRMSASGVLYVGGVAAHDGVDATNPVTAGYRAIAHGTNPTAVAAADVTVGYANRAGVPFVIGGHPNPVTIEAEYTAAQTDTAIVTIATGLKIVVTQVQVMADNANSVDVGFRVGFGTANTPTTTGVVLTHPGLQSGGVMSRGDGSGIVGVGADNADLRITSEVPTSGAIRVLVTYFTVES